MMPPLMRTQNPTQLALQRWGQPKRRTFRYTNCSIATSKIRSKIDANGPTAAHRICSLHDLPCCGNPPFPESAPATAVRLLQDMPRRGNPLFTESAPLRQSILCRIRPHYGDPPIAKTKIRTILQLFCDCGLFSVSGKRTIAALQQITCAFTP